MPEQQKLRRIRGVSSQDGVHLIGSEQGEWISQPNPEKGMDE